MPTKVKLWKGFTGLVLQCPAQQHRIRLYKMAAPTQHPKHAGDYPQRSSSCLTLQLV